MVRKKESGQTVTIRRVDTKSKVGRLRASIRVGQPYTSKTHTTYKLVDMVKEKDDPLRHDK